MKFRRAFVFSFAAASLLLTSACVTDPNTGKRRVSRAAIGAGVGTVGGLLLGGLVAGGAGRVIGAGIGGLAGAAIGTAEDKQIKTLREQTAGTGVEVRTAPGSNAILLGMPGGVTFDAGSDILKQKSQSALGTIAGNLQQYPGRLVDVYGNADASEPNAQMLSDSRARTVANFLIMRGVAETNVRTHGMAATMPLASSTTEEGRAQNRRVEIKIAPTP